MSSSVRALFVLFGIISIIAGCAPPPLYQASKGEVAHSKSVIEQSQAQQYPPPAPVVTQSGAYVDTTKVSLVRPPSWLKQRVTLHGVNLPLSFYLSEILTETDAVVYYDSSVDKKMLISLDYSGTIEGALRKLATLSNNSYTLDKKTHKLTWTALISKTFDIKFIPGTSSYTVGGQVGNATGSSGGGSSSSSGGSSGGGSVVGISDSQTSTFTGTPSIWADLQTAVKGLMSKEGTLSVSQSTTTLTARDHPDNMAAIERYISKLNRELTKQVRIQVQILEVRLTKEFAYGINWQVAANYLNPTRVISLNSPNFSNVNIPSLANLTPTTLTYNQTTGRFAGTNTLIEALQQQGEVSVVTQPSVVTLNNQIAQISIQQQQQYLSNVSSVTSDFSLQTSTEIGSITTGMAMYLLPKIQGNKIYLQISSTLADLEQLQTFNLSTGAVTNTNTNPDTSGDLGTDAQPGGSGTGATPGVLTGPNFIQLPKVDERIINQRAMILTGNTLVLAGYKRLGTQNGQSKFYEFDSLGGTSGSSGNAEVVLLITPTILDDEDEEYYEDVG